jgi:hypothetical protein
MSQSDSLLVKLRKYYFISVFIGFLGAFASGLVSIVLSSYSPESLIIGAIIGGLIYGSAEVVSLLGNTLWRRLLLWGLTVIVISNLVHLLVPSLAFSLVLHFVPTAPTALLNYITRKFPGYKKH